MIFLIFFVFRKRILTCLIFRLERSEQLLSLRSSRCFSRSFLSLNLLDFDVDFHYYPCARYNKLKKAGCQPLRTHL